MEEIWYVYILKCNNGSTYVGHTTDLERRIKEYNSHKVHYTRDKTPVRLISFIGLIIKYKAPMIEKYLKSGSGIAFK